MSSSSRTEVGHEEYSEEQEEVFARYIEGKNIFITGPGGTGKTRIIQRIYADAIEKGKRIQVCAMTGCAAVLLECKAKTIHSWSGMGLGQGDNEMVVMKAKKKKGVSKRWRDTDILIIDEVSMMSKKVFEILNLLAKRCRGKLGVPFGGLQVIFSGDFFQLPPVFRPAVDEADSGMFCFESPIWEWVFGVEGQIPLVKNFRQTDGVYTDILNEIREGRLSSEHADILRQRVGVTLDPALGLTPTQIYPINSKVADVNTVKMMELPEPTWKFVSEELDLNKLVEKNKNSKEELQQSYENLRKNSMFESELKLKLGAQVMHIVNKRIDGVFICNGEQGKVIGFERVPKAVDINVSVAGSGGDGGDIEVIKKEEEGAIENTGIEGDIGAIENTEGEREGDKNVGEWEEVPVVRFQNGLTLKVGYHEWMSEDLEGVGIRQIPLILAWAVSIHKCQGMTLGIAEVDIGSSVFECAQSYVALSRVKTLWGLFLKSFDPRKIRADPRAVEFYRNLGEQRKKILAERMLKQQEEKPLDSPTISRYFQALSSTPRPSMVVERGAVVSSGSPSVKGGCEIVEEDDYTVMADYMVSGKKEGRGEDSDVKIIDFSAYAYRGY
jgi:ATP-dependent DNA helicase PIF1